MLVINSEIEYCEANYFLASISNEKIKLVTQGITPEEAFKELLVSLQVHFAFNFGLQIEDQPIENLEHIEMIDGRCEKQIMIIF